MSRSNTARFRRLLESSIADADDYLAKRERRLAAEHLARKTPEERAALEAEWPVEAINAMESGR